MSNDVLGLQSKLLITGYSSVVVHIKITLTSSEVSFYSFIYTTSEGHVLRIPALILLTYQCKKPNCNDTANEATGINTGSKGPHPGDIDTSGKFPKPVAA